MLKEAHQLHKVGFSLHWLKEKSKAPVDGGWSKLKKRPWSELKNQFKPGLNVGVVLGASTKIEDTFLAVIDCDIKVNKTKFQKELDEKLKLLGVQNAPIVLSGRGNGSKHVYIRTLKPLKPKTFFRSKSLVKAHMPGSVTKPSKRDLRLLSKKEIEKGYRVRPAWEISLMGQGQQVVLPPSTHPDTGRQYEWLKPVLSKNDIPVVNLNKFYDDQKELKVEHYGDIDDVDVEALPISEEVKAKIVEGHLVEDRSAELLSVTLSMINSGISVEEILNILTNRDYYLGQCAYDHTKSSKRAVAKRWLEKYTIPKAKERADASTFFDIEIGPQVLSEEGEVNKQNESMKKLKSLEGWTLSLKYNENGGLKNNHFNIKHILNCISGGPSVARNAFSFEDVWLLDMPWGSKKGDTVTDDDVTRFKDYLVAKFQMEPTRDKINDALSATALQHEFHPVRDYLNGLEWDGVPRLSTWLEKYLGAEGDKGVLGAYGTRTLIGMVKRIYEPGCKHDSVLILEGVQNAGKSSTARILASEPWFSDSDINIGDKDAVVSMNGNWVIELGELSALSKRDVESLKQFISRSVDKIRPPYGKRLMSYPRQSIFIGTTNEDQYLKDKTGNRRYWPVKCGRIRLGALKKARDQLLAEAVFLYTIGEINYIDQWGEPDLWAKCQTSQEGRVLKDEMGVVLYNWLNNKDTKGDDMDACPFGGRPFTMSEIFEDPYIMQKLSIKNDRSGQMRLGQMLHDIGYTKKQLRLEHGKSVYWGKKGEKYDGKIWPDSWGVK